MSLARVKTWSSGEVLTASDLNSEFDNLLSNALSLISPITGTLDLNGNEFVLDVDADTSITSDTDDRIDFRIGGTDGMFIGLASGNTGAFLHIDPGAFTATANTDIGLIRVGNTAAVTVPAGTTAVAAGLYIETPNWTATGTITASAALYIEGAATEGTDDFSIWADAGDVRFDDDILWLSGQTYAQRGVMAHANTDVRTYTFPDVSGTVGLIEDSNSILAVQVFS